MSAFAMRKVRYGIVIALQTYPHDAFHACLGGEGMAAVSLALGDVGEMHLHHGNANSADAVGQGDGCVGIGTRVHHHGIESAVGFLQLVDEATFVVGLIISELMLRETLEKSVKVSLEGDVAVDFKFPSAQQVEIRPVDDENAHRVKFLQK